MRYMENLSCERIVGVRSRFESRITSNEQGHFAMIVRIETDGAERVIHGYNARHFKTRKGAEKSVAEYFRKQGW